VTPAIRLLERAGVEHRVHEYRHDEKAASYGLEAAHALGVHEAAVFKTLVASLSSGELVVAIIPVACQLDLKALAAATGAKKAVMAEPRAAERATGYVVGGISPLGQKRSLSTVVDDSALTQAQVYVSAGRRGLEIALAPDLLVSLTGARVASIQR
jgi:Cys-tRNA(Pro)/Cys-tRNA(Cys) deacylase